MKKSIIAMAVAGALAVPAIASADATLYGSFRMNLEKQTKPSTSANLNNNASRIGIRGTVDLGMENTVGIYNWETTLNVNDDGNGIGDIRYASMGATGDWGTALLGRLDHFTWNFAGGTTDLFQSGSGSILSVDYVGEGVDRLDRRTNNTLAYVSPDMNGLTLGAGVVMQGDAIEKDNEVDGYNLGAQYQLDGLSLGLGYGAVKTAKAGGTYLVDENIWSVAASYEIDNFTLAAAYEESRNKVPTRNIRDRGYSLAGNYEVDGLGGSLAYSTVKQNLDGAQRGKRVQAEIYNRMGNGMVSAGYIDNNKHARGGNSNTFYLGYRLDF